MKISNIFQTTNIFQSNIKQKSEKKSNIKKTDNLNLSSEALNFQNVMKSVKNAPDIREDKVKAISEKIKNGTYFVSSEQIAEKILES